MNKRISFEISEDLFKRFDYYCKSNDKKKYKLIEKLIDNEVTAWENFIISEIEKEDNNVETCEKETELCIEEDEEIFCYFYPREAIVLPMNKSKKSNIVWAS